MEDKYLRIAYTIGALFIGATVMWGISLASNGAHGPMDALCTRVSSAIYATENAYIVKQKEDSREKKLQWFAPYKKDINLLRNPKHILMGAHDNHIAKSFECIVGLEDSLRIHFPLVHVYAAWGSKPEHEFPTKQMQAISAMGSVPVITWEPWLNGFDEEKFPLNRKGADRNTGGLADIVKGVYDSYIIGYAKSVAAFKQPVMLRLGHEMNDPYRYPWGPQNNAPQDYVDAWRHVHEIFTANGAKNVVWIWSPHPTYGYFELFYPGDAYVDYVAVDALNFGTVASWSQWWSFDAIFGSHYKELAAFKKPIMLAELGSLTCGGDRNQWFSEALSHLPEKYPAVKSILFFHVVDDNTTTEKAISWMFATDTACTRVISREIHAWPNLGK